MLARLKSFRDWLPAARFAPSVGSNTFFVWEPCTQSHAEVVPGFVRYLLDLGYEVGVFVTPARYDEGLFSRFDNPRLRLYSISQASIRRYFRENGLSNAKGLLISTARKISGGDTYEYEKRMFAARSASQRLLLVEHDAKVTADNGSLGPEIITLRKIHYKNALTTVVNPHFFGEVEVTGKNEDVVRFITIGAMRAKRRNTALLVEAVQSLTDRGIANFEIAIIGRGSLRGIPSAIRRHFDIKGRVDFSRLYAEMERADYFLPLLDPQDARHDRYITTGTSGNFQLIYGFAKPCLIAKKFAALNGFDDGNGFIYADNDGLAQAMADAIHLPPDRYRTLQQALTLTAGAIQAQSFSNLRALIGT